MKKLLALILAAALALSLVACGGGSGAGDTNTSSTGNGDTTSTGTPSGGGEDSTPDETSSSDGQVFHLGDTVTTGDLELTLTKFEYGEILDNTSATNNIRNENYLLPLPDDEIGRYEALKQYTPGAITYEASDGHILISFAIEVKSFSKTALNLRYIFDRIDIDYNNGYTFEYTPGLQVNIDDSWENPDGEIEPLNNKIYEFRGYAEVPEEVMTNTENSLNVNIYLDGQIYGITNVTGRTTPDLIFNIR